MLSSSGMCSWRAVQGCGRCPAALPWVGVNGVLLSWENAEPDQEVLLGPDAAGAARITPKTIPENGSVKRAWARPADAVVRPGDLGVRPIRCPVLGAKGHRCPWSQKRRQGEWGLLLPGTQRHRVLADCVTADGLARAVVKATGFLTNKSS